MWVLLFCGSSLGGRSPWQCFQPFFSPRPEFMFLSIRSRLSILCPMTAIAGRRTALRASPFLLVDLLVLFVPVGLFLRWWLFFLNSTGHGRNSLILFCCELFFHVCGRKFSFLTPPFSVQSRFLLLTALSLRFFFFF